MPYGNYSLILGGNSFKLITEGVNFLYLKSLQFLGNGKNGKIREILPRSDTPRSGYRVLLPFSFGPTWLFLLMQQNFMYNHNRFIRKEKCQFHSVHVF